MSSACMIKWHDGEDKMYRLLHSDAQMENPTSVLLSASCASTLHKSPLIAIGTLDDQKRPWTTIWGGLPGLSRSLGNSSVEIKALVDGLHDPVVKALLGTHKNGTVQQVEQLGRMVSGLGIDLETRNRVKIYGRMTASSVTLTAQEDSCDNEQSQSQPEIHLVVDVEQSIGNCPKYLNCKKIRPASISSSLSFESPDLTPEAVDLVDHADVFFVSTSNFDIDMDTNHRGGSPGFVRLQRRGVGEWDLFWPEYSGNRFYQTLGNLQTTPLAGLVFPNFSTGDVLYLTGKAEILIGGQASAVLPRSKLVVKIRITVARLVKHGLPFRGDPGESSPYNPPVHALVSETSAGDPGRTEGPQQTAKLLSQTRITPTISRYHFRLNNPMTPWTAGQWVAFDFYTHLDQGRTHMYEDSPSTLNDDFIRTFTVSSPPIPRRGEGCSDMEFSVTVRTVGRVTKFLSRQQSRDSLTVKVRGFGGEVRIEQDHDNVTACVVSGVGVTPILAQLHILDWERLKVWWTLHIDDVDLVVDVLSNHSGVGRCLSVFLTGVTTEAQARKRRALHVIRKSVATCEMRRLSRADLIGPSFSHRWHLCVSTKLRQTLMEWLEGEEVIYEDFNF